MRISRKIRWIGGVAVVVIAAVLAIMYIYANREPAGYSPAPMTTVQREAEAGLFIRRIQDFGNETERNQPFTWVITQEELNRALGSIPQIAEKLEEGQAASVQAAMKKIGIADPALSLDDGKMTIMLRATQLDKVVSIDVALAITPDQKLSRKLVGSRVGRLPMPDSLMEDFRTKLQKSLARKPHAPKPDGGTSTVPGLIGLSSDDVSAVTVDFLLSDEPLPAVFTWPINHKRVQIESIKIEKGQMILKIVPAPKASRDRKGADTPAGR